MRGFGILLMLLVFSSCRTYTSPFQAKKYIRISEGGGFTGALTTYYVLKNGEVFYQIPNTDKTRKMASIQKKDARYFFRQTKKYVSDSNLVKDPDNIYRVLEYATRDSSYSFVWYHGHPQLDSLYDQIKRGIDANNRLKYVE